MLAAHASSLARLAAASAAWSSSPCTQAARAPAGRSRGRPGPGAAPRRAGPGPCTSLRAWRTSARSCCVSVSGWVSSQPPSASSSAIRSSRQRLGLVQGRASAAPSRCSARPARRARPRSVSASSPRISLPMNCIWRRLPSKLVMRLASCDRVDAAFPPAASPSKQVGAQGQQRLAELLQLGAFALQFGLAGFVGALELALEFQVELAAFGDELAADEVAFFGFA